MEWLVEKAVEIGVNKIVFLECEHSVRRIVKRERIKKIMVSAMKQSLKATLPDLVEMQDFKDFVSSDTSARKYVSLCGTHSDCFKRLKRGVFRSESPL